MKIMKSNRRQFRQTKPDWLTNLTEYAFTIHMELGLLITGGGLPKQIEEHFDRLISRRVLVKV